MPRIHDAWLVAPVVLALVGCGSPEADRRARRRSSRGSRRRSSCRASPWSPRGRRRRVRPISFRRHRRAWDRSSGSRGDIGRYKSAAGNQWVWQPGQGTPPPPLAQPTRTPAAGHSSQLAAGVWNGRPLGLNAPGLTGTGVRWAGAPSAGSQSLPRDVMP